MGTSGSKPLAPGLGDLPTVELASVMGTRPTLIDPDRLPGIACYISRAAERMASMSM